MNQCVAIAVACFTTVLAGCQRSRLAGEICLEALKNSEFQMITAGGAASPDLHLAREWDGNICRSRLSNRGRAPVRVKEVILFRGTHNLPPETGLYGEGFTMLSQTGGTLGSPADIGAYTDAKHYRIPQAPDAITVYSLAVLSPPSADRRLLAFTSCNRFQGIIRLRPHQFEIVLDMENLELAPGGSWQLEEFQTSAGKDREELLANAGLRIGVNHHPLNFPQVPTGWCSWYCFGPKVTFQQIQQNLEVMAAKTPYLTYVQIDDGYELNMGDWLDVRQDFGGSMKSLCGLIGKRGLKPAVWVAPFLAEEKSRVFEEHPDWFIQDGTGKPLRSDRVSFGGWQRGPWYALDGTNGEAQAHIERIFRTMREEWGVRYFKLDATFWGALHGGRFHDPSATRIEAYRRGMQAVLRGAGDAFVLAANHPMWPSLGLIHASRSSMDVAGSWDSIRSTARENFFRGWQHRRLWLNDPDVVMLSGKASEDEMRFRWAAAFATGGPMLAGDDLSKVPDQRLSILRKLTPPTGVAAVFPDETFRVGSMSLPGRTVFTIFNWEDTPQPANVHLPSPSRVQDFWSGEDLGHHDRVFSLPAMPPHSTRVIVATGN